MGALKKTMWRLLRAMGLAPQALAFTPNGYLRQQGWPRTVNAGYAMDADGKPLPWYAYPCIHFLAERLRPEFNVFEYGAGVSTLWYAARVASVTAAEHDAGWFAQLQAKLSAHKKVNVLQVNEAAYAGSIAQHPGPYDVICIDGIDRNACVTHALAHLKPDGVIVFDNTERAELYAEGFRQLKDAGFKRIDFNGMGPVVAIALQTTVFYRTDNVLGI